MGDLLDVSRIVAGKLDLELGPVDLAPVIETGVDSVRYSTEAKGSRGGALPAGWRRHR